MNYFAHGVRFLDRPYFLAGTALPDWLSVVDRQVRLRTRRVAPFHDGGDSPEAQLAAGVLQHLHDDEWFHNSIAFAQVSGELTRSFRELLPEEGDHRPGLLGHIVTELLLDAVLIRRDPESLEVYYRRLREIEPSLVEAQVNRMSPRSTDRLVWFIGAFHSERFLADYLVPERMLFRLNQVLRRVTLPPLPHEAVRVLESAWTPVEARADELLAGFGQPPSSNPGISDIE
jgi:hypothetical protein